MAQTEKKPEKKTPQIEPGLLVDPVEESGGPHWLERYKEQKKPAGEKPKTNKTEKKTLEQIRRKNQVKHLMKQYRQKSTDENIFMMVCVDTLGDEDVCQWLWDNGEEDLIEYRRKEYDESKHPRDDHGRWGHGSGPAKVGDDPIKTSKSPASDLLARNNDDSVSLEQLKAQLSPEFKKKEAEALEMMGGRMISQKEFSGPDGKYLPERAELHRKIIRELFTPEAIKAATPPSGTKPTLTLSGGRPAAGKTSSLKKELDAKIKTSFYINADEIQEKLPGYKGMLAGVYNGEAQDVALMAEKVARNMGLNIIYDATLKSKQPAIDRVRNYKDAGYEVDGYFVHTTPATSVMRSAARFMHDPDGVGRYLPPEISFNSKTNENTFDALIPELREWALYDNNGAKPVKMAGNLK